jgi:two-component system, chemotaxis family, response regulator Rcp1
MNNIASLTIKKRVAHILLIEDNPGDVLLTQLAFKKAKISNNMTIARSAEEGLAMLEKKNPYSHMELPDLIFLDLNLPGMSGYDLLSIIKNNDKLKHLPVIILTSANVDDDKLRTNAVMANGYLTKPLKIDNLCAILNE